MAYSSQGSHTGRPDFCNWPADGSTTGQCDLHYAPSSLIMSTFLIRSATSPSSSYLIVLTRLGGPRSRPNPHLIKTPKFITNPLQSQYNHTNCWYYSDSEYKSYKLFIPLNLLVLKYWILNTTKPIFNTTPKLNNNVLFLYTMIEIVHNKIIITNSVISKALRLILRENECNTYCTFVFYSSYNTKNNMLFIYRWFTAVTTIDDNFHVFPFIALQNRE